MFVLIQLPVIFRFKNAAQIQDFVKMFHVVYLKMMKKSVIIRITAIIMMWVLCFALEMYVMPVTLSTLVI